MSLPYFPMFPKDFEAKTSHLSLMEDGAYNRLLRLCWMTPGCSLPADEAWIMRRMRAVTDDERGAVLAVLAEFFTVSEGRYSNARLCQEWDAANAAHEKRVQAGAKGGKAKALKTNETASSNAGSDATAMPKQPEPEPEPYIPEANASGPSVDPAKDLIDRGVLFLGRHGVADRQARSLIGKWRKEAGDERLRGAFRECQAQAIADPVAWITRALAPHQQPDLAALMASIGPDLR